MPKLDYSPIILIQDTTRLTREEWLEARRQGIGGSDAAIVMEESPWKTKADLYLDKLGLAPDTDDENWVQKEIGKLLEPLIARIFEKKTGFHIVDTHAMYQHPIYPFMIADIDYLIQFDDGTYGILECKHTERYNLGEWENDSQPYHYTLQGAHYMSVLNLDKLYFACLYGNSENDFLRRYMERDYELEQQLILEELDFWQNFVQKKTAPPFGGKTDLALASLRRRFRGNADADAIKLTQPEAQMLLEALELKEQKSELEKQVKVLDERIKHCYVPIMDRMGDSCKAVYDMGDGKQELVATWNPYSRKTVTADNLEKLQLHHPSIYKKYVTDSAYRRFDVKLKAKPKERGAQQGKTAA